MARFVPSGNVTIHKYTTAPASLAAITAAEVTAGASQAGSKDGEGLASYEGFTESGSSTPVPDMISRTTGSIPGENTFDDGMLVWYRDVQATPNNALFEGYAVDDLFWLSVAFNGNTTGEDYEVFACQVTTVNIDNVGPMDPQTQRITASISSKTSGTFAA